MSVCDQLWGLQSGFSSDLNVTYSEPLRVNIDIMFLTRTENAFHIPKFLVLAGIFEIKLLKKENFF